MQGVEPKSTSIAIQALSTLLQVSGHRPHTWPYFCILLHELVTYSILFTSVERQNVDGSSALPPWHYYVLRLGWLRGRWAQPARKSSALFFCAVAPGRKRLALDELGETTDRVRVMPVAKLQITAKVST